MKINWIANLFLWACALPALPIQYFMLRNEVKRKKNIIVGVTFPYEAQNRTEIQKRLDKYIRELNLITLLLLAVVVPCCWISSFSMAMFAWGVWLLLAIILPNIPYARCNLDLKKIKDQNGWNHQSSEIMWVDTSAIPNEKWLSPWLFAPAVLLCLLPVVWDKYLLAVYLLDAVCAAGCWTGYRYLYRNRAEIVDSNADLSQVLSHVRRRNWGKVWLYCAYFLAVINLITGLMVQQVIFSLGLLLLLSILLIFAAVGIEFKTRRAQEKLTAESGKEWYVDEDDKWIWGLIYYNPHDSKTIVNARVGMNSTFNLARPAGKIFTALTALIMIAIPFFGVLLDGVGDKQIDLQINTTTIVASHGKSQYEVALEDIEEVTLLDTLPEGLQRIAGTGMQNLQKGRFRSPELGALTLCLDPQCPPFLLITTNDGRQFLFGTRDPSVINNIFSKLDRGSQ